MPVVRKLTADNDFEYIAGRQALVDSKQAHAQAVKVCVLHVEGENLFFPSLGMNLGAIGSASNDEKAQEIRKAILKSGRVRSILEVTQVEELGRARRPQFRVRCLLKDNRELLLGVEA